MVLLRHHYIYYCCDDLSYPGRGRQRNKSPSPRGHTTTTSHFLQPKGWNNYCTVQKDLLRHHI